MNLETAFKNVKFLSVCKLRVANSWSAWFANLRQCFKVASSALEQTYIINNWIIHGEGSKCLTGTKDSDHARFNNPPGPSMVYCLWNSLFDNYKLCYVRWKTSRETPSLGEKNLTIAISTHDTHTEEWFRCMNCNIYGYFNSSFRRWFPSMSGLESKPIDSIM